MAETSEFFTSYLPEKLKNNPSLQASVKNSIVFDIKDAGTWTLDLRDAPGAITEGAIENPGCVITCSKADWEKILESPSYAMQAFMMGKLKATNVALAMSLQKILA